MTTFTFSRNITGTDGTINVSSDDTIEFYIGGGGVDWTQIIATTTTNCTVTTTTQGTGTGTESGTITFGNSSANPYAVEWRQFDGDSTFHYVKVSGTVSIVTDDVPDAFDTGLGGDANGVGLNSGNYESLQSSITGINTSVTAVFTGTGDFRVNNGTYSSSNKSVVVNDTIQIRVPAASTANTTNTGNVTIGGVTGSFSVITEDPSSSGSGTGDGGTGNYGLRCWNDSNELVIDITDRVTNAVETVSGTLTTGDFSNTHTLSQTGNVAIHLNPSTNFTKVVNGELLPNTDVLLKLSLSGTQLTVSRDTAGSSIGYTVLVVNN